MFLLDSTAPVLETVAREDLRAHRAPEPRRPMTETALSAPPTADTPAAGATAPAPDVAEVAAHAVRSARIDRALRAVEDLARQRRAHELVEAVERLGAGLGTTLAALDEAVESVSAVEATVAPPSLVAVPDPAWDAPVDRTETEPAAAPLALVPAPVSQPVVTQPVAAQPVAAQPVAAEPVATQTAAPVEPVATDGDPARARRQAPADLAAFVIDFGTPAL